MKFQQPDIVMESWDIWDSTQPQVVQNSQSNTRTGLMGLQTTNHSVRGRRLDSDTEPEPEPDYFQDMEPDFIHNYSHTGKATIPGLWTRLHYGDKTLYLILQAVPWATAPLILLQVWDI